MNRRRFLGSLTAVSLLGTAGCISEGTGGVPTDDETGDSSPTASPDDSPTDTPGDDDPNSPTETPENGGDETDQPRTSTDNEESSIRSESLEVTDSGCGVRGDDANVSFDDSAGTVTVTGNIWANDLTYTARLASVTLDGDVMTVTVAAEKKSDDAVGGQCISEIEYEATVTVDGALPATVTVRHRRGDETKTIATAEY